MLYFVGQTTQQRKSEYTMTVMTIRVREDGSVLLPETVSRQLGLLPDAQIVVEAAQGRSPLENNYLILH